MDIAVEIRLSILACCSGSSPPAWPTQWWSGGWSWSQGCCVSLLVSFCVTVKGGVGSGPRRQHNSFVYVVVSGEENNADKARLLSLRWTTGD